MHLTETNFRPNGAAIGETRRELEQDIILVLLYQTRRLVLLYQAPRLVPADRPRAKPDPTRPRPRPDAQRPTRPGTKKGDPKVAQLRESLPDYFMI